jgi:UDP-2,4-diacetamido-2,4,6-trideoxy-beta-L-altropyranose hydrolase
MATPEIVFALEVGAAFGLGHMMRCRVLASELARRGCGLALAVRGDLAVLDRWPWPMGTTVIGLRTSAEDAAADILALAREHRPDWLVVDGYGLAATPLLLDLRREGRRTLAIDDIASAPVPADIILNQNMLDAAPYGADARLLLGPRFALVAEDYCAARRTSDEPAHIQRALVSFGGSDRKGMTAHVLRCLTASSGISQVDVVAGPYHAESRAAVAAGLSVRYHHAPPSLASLMASADVVISAGGSGCWEVCCVGRPLIALQTAANQRHVLATVRRSGAGITLDRGAEQEFREDEFMAAWQGIRDLEVRRRLATAARGLVDGMGAARVADALGVDPGQG